MALTRRQVSRREHDAERSASQPWRARYASPEWGQIKVDRLARPAQLIQTSYEVSMFEPLYSPEKKRDEPRGAVLIAMIVSALCGFAMGVLLM